MQVSNFTTRIIEVSGDYTYYSWKVDINSDVDNSNCVICISFRDSNGFEIHTDVYYVSIVKGPNFFTSKDICETNIWDQVTSYFTHIRCQTE